MMKLSNNLFLLMKDEGLNTVSLGETLDIDSSVIARFLRDERLPTLQTLVKIADYFCVSTDYLCGLKEETTSSFQRCPPFHERFEFLLKYFKTNKNRLHLALKISTSVIYSWTTGAHTPSLPNAIKLAEHFNCSLDFLIGREN